MNQSFESLSSSTEDALMSGTSGTIPTAPIPLTPASGNAVENMASYPREVSGY